MKNCYARVTNTEQSLCVDWVKLETCGVQDLLAPGASNFYAVNDYIAVASFQAPAKAFVLSGLMSEEQVSASVAVPCLEDRLIV